MASGIGWGAVHWSYPLRHRLAVVLILLTVLSIPLLVIQDEELRPVQVGMRYFFATGTAEGTPWGQIMAYTTMITIPVIVVFMCFQRSFVSSVASAGVKG